jgi:regulator of replication initiation timing
MDIPRVLQKPIQTLKQSALDALPENIALTMRKPTRKLRRSLNKRPTREMEKYVSWIERITKRGTDI